MKLREKPLDRGGFIMDADVRDFVEWSYLTGMRPNESRSLTWAMFDRETWVLRLDPRATKIGRGRVLALEGPLRAILERRSKRAGWSAR